MILQRLNMDNSWHLQLSETRILIDPWLEGVEVDYFRWFNTQWHRTEPLPYDALPPFDAVLITQKYADHCHTRTLERLQPKVVLAPVALERTLSRLLPDATRHLFDDACRRHTVGAIQITQLPTRRRLDPIYDAYVVTDERESALIANHGFALDEDHRTQLGEGWTCDVLLSPFNRYTLPGLLGGVVTPGLEGLEDLIAQTRPRAVAQTHDEPKHARGLIPRLARIDTFDPSTVAELPWLRDRYLPITDYTPVTP